MGLFEKNRCRKFLEFCQDYDLEKKEKKKDFDPNENFSSLIKKFGLETNTTDFIGHAVALYTNDDFLEKASYDTLCKIRLYMNSVGRYGIYLFLIKFFSLIFSLII
jgi:Rab GDP dissociation inhibitor